jgi:GDPmannose 4,6-dehydratase
LFGGYFWNISINSGVIGTTIKGAKIITSPVTYISTINAIVLAGFEPVFVDIDKRTFKLNVDQIKDILKKEDSDDYVVGTGESHSVKEFVERVCSYTGIEIEWEGNGVSEKGRVRSLSSSLPSTLSAGDVLVEIDPKYFRPTEVDCLQADITKARKRLQWAPRTTFDELVKIMVDYDMKMIGLDPVGEGIKACGEKGFIYTNHDFSLSSTSNMTDR